MSRKTLSHYLPERERILQARSLQFLRRHLAEPGLWHLNRRSASRAMFLGLYCALIPLPVQMLLAALGAIAMRANLPLCVALVWLHNPLTILPILYYSYVLGCHLLGWPALDAGSLEHLLLHRSGGVVSHQGVVLPLLLGSQLAGLVAGATGYAGMRLYWRWHVLRAWQRRNSARTKLA
jgi:uncharacterized protein (DUF2062 family)